MGNYLNPDNSIFQYALNGEIYIDKSELIQYTNNLLFTPNRFVCVSRPRRFGKSCTADMLKAYYGRGCDSHAQFDGLEISKSPDYEKNINKYNVIYLDAASFFDECQQDGFTTQQSINRLKSLVTRELTKEYPGISHADETFTDYLSAVYSETQIPFVFIIDEWDAMFRITKEDTEGQGEYLRFLNTLLKQKSYVALAYMTGILPIKKYATGSALNMFREYTMLNPGPVKEYIGFTSNEVEDLAKRYSVSYDDLKYWYDGYNLDGVEIYNSNSVVRALTENDLQCYWEKTESFEELFGYIKEDRFGIHRVILDLLSDIKRTVNFSGYMNDLVTINNLDDIIAILVHLGYLAFDKKSAEMEDCEKIKTYPGETLTDDDVLRLMVKSDGTVRIPNHEIREEFLTVLKNLGSFESNEFELLSAKIVNLTFCGESDEDMEALAERIERVHDEYVSDYHNYDTEDSLSNTVRLAYFNLINDYYSRTEASSSRGRADVIFTPRKGRMYLPMVMEFKVDDSAENAIQQIKDKRYYKAFYEYKGDVLLLGIVYDSKTKKHVVKKEIISVDNSKLL